MTDIPGSNEPGWADPDRGDLTAILGAGEAAVDPARQVAESLADDPVLQGWAGELAATPPPRARQRRAGLPDRPRLVLLSVGRAAVSMARGAVQVLGDLVDGGWVLAPHGSGSRPPWLPPQVEFRTGGAALPDEVGVQAAREVAALLDSLQARDRLLVLVSPRAATLLTLPVRGVAVADVAATTRYLADEGVSAGERARVLAAVDELGDGGLLRRAAPASVLGLILPAGVAGTAGARRSLDHPGLRDAVLLEPRTEGGRAVEILLRRAALWDGLPASVRSAIRAREVPPVPAVDPVVRHLAGGEGAVDGAAREARRRGYRVRVLSRTLSGEAGRVGAGLARAAMAVRDGVVPTGLPACLLAAGDIRESPRMPKGQGLSRAVAAGAAGRLPGQPGIEVGGLEVEEGGLVVALVTR